ncbi:MAG TPA: hypothetical protein VIE89_21650 [Candidatus Binatia bacterium]
MLTAHWPFCNAGPLPSSDGPIHPDPLSNLQEIFALDAGIFQSESFDDRHQFVSVLVISGDKDIEIACITWPPMECERPGAADHILNTVRVQ